jgi:hypothetical protein
MTKIVEYFESNVFAYEVIDFLNDIHNLQEGEVGITDDSTIPFIKLLTFANVTYVAVKNDCVVGLIMAGFPMPYAVENGRLIHAVPIIYVNAYNIFTGRRLVRTIREKFSEYPVTYGTTSDASLPSTFIGEEDVDVHDSLVLGALK